MFHYERISKVYSTNKQFVFSVNILLSSSYFIGRFLKNASIYVLRSLLARDYTHKYLKSLFWFLLIFIRLGTKTENEKFEKQNRNFRSMINKTRKWNAIRFLNESNMLHVQWFINFLVV